MEQLMPGSADIEHFRTKGWWVSPPILDEAVLEDALRGAARIYRGEFDQPLPDGRTHVGWQPSDGDVLRKNDHASLLVRELRGVTMSRVIGAVAARLTGADGIRLWHDQLLYKPTTTAQATPADVRPHVGWHTDRQYWQSASSASMLTAWVPFHEVRSEHGPVMFVDGSHLWDDVTGDFWDPDLGSLTRLAADRETHVSEALVPRGGVSFHHCRTIHGSGTNTSGEPRRAIAVHLQDAPNRFRHHRLPDSTMARHGLDSLVRRTVDGDPDYSDPAICPLLWP
ncbi:hypothetical protein GCM10009841_32290 [Microlunatus panaciterrae]